MTGFFCEKGLRASIPTLRNAQSFPRALLLSGGCSVVDFGVERARDTDQQPLQGLMEEQLWTYVGPRHFMSS